jgi:hypothetical protein
VSKKLVTIMEGIETTWLLIIVAGIALWIVVTYYLLRFVFSIKRQLWNQRQQINILIRIAEKLGVNTDDEQLSNIQTRNNNKDDEQID